MLSFWKLNCKRGATDTFKTENAAQLIVGLWPDSANAPASNISTVCPVAPPETVVPLVAAYRPRRQSEYRQLFSWTRMGATFADLSGLEVETIAEELKGTAWLALFSRVSRQCRAAAARVTSSDNGEALMRCLEVREMAASVELVKWAKAQGCPSLGRRRVSKESLKSQIGHLKVLKWAGAEACELDSYICFHAALDGRLDVLKWMADSGCKWNRSYVYQAAAIRGRPEVLEWLWGSR